MIATMTITEFLLARIAEDEAAARASSFPPDWDAWPDEIGQPIKAGNYRIATCAASVMGHIARNDPARVLAKCKAERRIVEMLAARDEQDHPAVTAHATGLRLAVKALAAVYADHPDYRDEWRP